MNKKLILLSGLALLTVNTYSLEDYKLSLGMGAIDSKSPYRGVGNDTSAVPLINFEYKDFYIKGGDIKNAPISLGYNAYKTDNLLVSTFINPWGGYNMDRNEMSSDYNDLDKRSYQVEGGIKAQFDTGWNNLKLDWYGLVGEEGGHTGIGLFRPIPMQNGKLIVIPKVSATFFNGDYLDYYFGVSKDEAARNNGINDEYKANSGMSFGFDLAATYFYSPELSITAFAGIEKLSDEVKDSPIVEEDVISKVGVLLNYSF